MCVCVCAVADERWNESGREREKRIRSEMTRDSGCEGLGERKRVKDYQMKKQAQAKAGKHVRESDLCPSSPTAQVETRERERQARAFVCSSVSGTTSSGLPHTITLRHSPAADHRDDVQPRYFMVHSSSRTPLMSEESEERERDGTGNGGSRLTWRASRSVCVCVCDSRCRRREAGRHSSRL